MKVQARQIRSKKSLLPTLTALRQEIILTGDSGRTKLGELWLVTHAGEEWIGIDCWIEAIVSLYGPLQERNCGVGLATVNKISCGVVVHLGIIDRLHRGRQTGNFCGWLVLYASQQHVVALPNRAVRWVGS
jgi:hypothetical protein